MIRFGLGAARNAMSLSRKGRTSEVGRDRFTSGWNRLARFGAYRCAFAQEVRRDQPPDTKTSFGCAAPVAQSDPT